MIESFNDLLSKYKRAQTIGFILFTIEISVSLLALNLFNINFLKTNILETLIVLGIVILPTLLSYAYHFTKNQKKLENIKDSARFGEFTKTKLIHICKEVCHRMGIKYEDVSFYITADKQLNASALTMGFGKLVKSLNVVTLNKTTLSTLNEEEIKTVIAHELAHIYRYPLFYYQMLPIRLLSNAIISLALFSILTNIIFTALILGAYQALVGRFFGSYSICIEFLCDHTGGEIGGLLPALRAEYLIARHSEISQEGYFELLKAKREGRITSSKEIIKILDNSLSYDQNEREQLISEIEKNIKAHEEKTNESFFNHFKSQIFSDSIETEDHIEEEYNQIKKAREVKTISLPEADNRPSLEWFKEVVKLIKEDTNTPIFKTPNDLNDLGSTHPGPRRRIVFLFESFKDSPS